MSLYSELKRRNVFRVGMAYLVGAWLVAQVVQLATEAFAAPDWIMRLLLVVLVLGFPAVLAFSWAYELTPEGLKRESQVERPGAITHQTARRLDYLTIALVLAAVALLLADRYLLEPRQPSPATAGSAAATPADRPQAAESAPAAPEERSIAVLPFVNMSDDPENQYFADGLAEELINRLSQLPELRVAGRTSSFQFKGRNLDLREIADRLGVSHILEGSVRRSGDRARITAQLIRAEDGSHLWSRTYDRELEDVLEVQDEIAVRVANNLDVVLDARRREMMRQAGVPNVDAFIEFQKGWQKFVEAHQADDVRAALVEANEHFRRATELYPEFGDAWYWQADLYQHALIEEHIAKSEREYAAAENDRLLSAAVEHARTPQQSVYSEFTRAVFARDWSNLPTLFRRAVDAGSCSYINWSELLVPFGLADRAWEAYRRYRDCQGPLGIQGYLRLVELLIVRDRAEEALAATDDMIASLGQSDAASHLRVQALLALERPQEAVRESALIDEAHESYGHTGAMALAAAENMAAANAAADQWLARPERDYRARLQLYAVLGRAGEANEVAAAVDATPAGHVMLAGAILGCLCGALFDIEITLNLKARLEEAGLPWPPAEPIEYPAKPW